MQKRSQLRISKFSIFLSYFLTAGQIIGRLIDWIHRDVDGAKVQQIHFPSAQVVSRLVGPTDQGASDDRFLSTWGP